ncbi:MAG TPA: low affinity iron permease family protein [Candidatus Bathyarchaeia archaeon]|nr:low affinity iron permease family protein [Candidatus Bathyarchaeia archaeon]
MSDQPHAAPGDVFRRMAHRSADIFGSAWAFIGALLLVAAWAALGPYFRYSDSWQLVINTGTTIVTFLMVFLIQNAQNRDARAIHLKLDELIRGVRGARNGMISLEELTEEQLDALQQEFQRIRAANRTQPPSRTARLAKLLVGNSAGRPAKEGERP